MLTACRWLYEMCHGDSIDRVEQSLFVDLRITSELYAADIILGGGRRDDRSVFSPPPGLTVSVLTNVFALRPKK